jgi:integrase
VLFAPEPLPSLLTALAAAPGVRLRGVKRGLPRGYPAVVAGDGGPALAYVEDADDPRRLLFTTPTGHPVSHGNFYARVYRPTIARLWPEGHRLHRARFHDLRHSVATQRLDDGDTPTDVMKLLGHSQLATTTDLYGRHRQLAAAKQTAQRTAAAWHTATANVVPLRPAQEA